jgi:hypothetical protein
MTLSCEGCVVGSMEESTGIVNKQLKDLSRDEVEDCQTVETSHGNCEAEFEEKTMILPAVSPHACAASSCLALRHLDSIFVT